MSWVKVVRISTIRRSNCFCFFPVVSVDSNFATLLNGTKGLDDHPKLRANVNI